MPIALPTYKPKLQTGSTDILVEEIEITTINVKIPFVLNNGLNQLIIKANNQIKINFDNGTKNFTIPKGNCFSLSEINFNDKILYIEAGIASRVEILQLFS